MRYFVLFLALFLSVGCGGPPVGTPGDENDVEQPEELSEEEMEMEIEAGAEPDEG